MNWNDVVYKGQRAINGLNQGITVKEGLEMNTTQKQISSRNQCERDSEGDIIPNLSLKFGYNP